MPSPAMAWQARVVGSGAGVGVATAVVATADGDIIAGGYVDQMGTATDFAVARLAGVNGAERWRATIPGPVMGGFGADVADHVNAIALDPSGNVIAAGGSSSAGPSSELTALKLDGSTGASIWSYDIGGFVDEAIAVVVDSAGDAFVAGIAESAGEDRFTVVKLAGDTGMPIWTVQRDAGRADAIALLPDGDVLVGGGAGPGSVVVRLDGATGAERWRANLSPNGLLVLLAVTPGGRVFAATATCHDTCNVSDVAVTRLSSVTGGPIWSEVIPPASSTEGLGALAPTPDDNVLLIVNAAAPSGRCLDADKFRTVLVDGAQGTVLADRTVAARSTSPSLVCTSGPVGYAAAVAASGSVFVGGTEPIVARLAPPDLHDVWRLPQPMGVRSPGTFLTSAVAVAGARVAVAGSAWTPTSQQYEFSVLSLDAESGHLEACGDGVVDPNEQCDDGNVADGDCCSSDCTIEAPDGTACDDGNACTLGDACASGVCRGPTPLPCEPCGTCDPSGGCLGSPVDPCARPTATNTAMLTIRRAHRGRRAEWTLRSGPATSAAALGDPRTATTWYAFCGYDADRVLLRGTAPGGGSCGHGGACWHRTRHGFVYDDPKAPDGLSHVAIHAGGAGRTRLAVAGRGMQLLSPALPVDSRDIVVQLRRTDDPGTCWTAEHTDILVNRSRVMRARGD